MKRNLSLFARFYFTSSNHLLQSKWHRFDMDKFVIKTPRDGKPNRFCDRKFPFKYDRIYLMDIDFKITWQLV